MTKYRETTTRTRRASTPRSRTIDAVASRRYPIPEMLYQKIVMIKIVDQWYWVETHEFYYIDGTVVNTAEIPVAEENICGYMYRDNQGTMIRVEKLIEGQENTINPQWKRYNDQITRTIGDLEMLITGYSEAVQNAEEAQKQLQEGIIQPIYKIAIPLWLRIGIIIMFIMFIIEMLR